MDIFIFGFIIGGTAQPFINVMMNKSAVRRIYRIPIHGTVIGMGFYLFHWAKLNLQESYLEKFDKQELYDKILEIKKLEAEEFNLKENSIKNLVDSFKI